MLLLLSAKRYLFSLARSSRSLCSLASCFSRPARVFHGATALKYERKDKDIGLSLKWMCGASKHCKNKFDEPPCKFMGRGGVWQALSSFPELMSSERHSILHHFLGGHTEAIFGQAEGYEIGVNYWAPIFIQVLPATWGSAPLEACVPFTTTAGSSSPKIWAVADRALVTRDGMAYTLVTYDWRAEAAR